VDSKCEIFLKFIKKKASTFLNPAGNAHRVFQEDYIRFYAWGAAVPLLYLVTCFFAAKLSFGPGLKLTKKATWLYDAFDFENEKEAVKRSRSR